MRLGRFGAKAEVTGALVGLCRELHALPAAQRREALLSLSPATQEAIRALDYEWLLLARPEQLAPPPPWRWWIMSGGRGGGKTRSATEQVIEWAHENPGIRIALVGRDAGSRNRYMLNGQSGILHRSPPWFKPRWHKTDKMLVWPNETVADLHSAEEPVTLRGPEYHKAWITELFHWNIPKGEKEPTAWREGIKLSLRLGDEPQGIVDSSPRATEFCADLLLGAKDARGDRQVSQKQIDSGEWPIEHVIVDQEGKEHHYRNVVRRWSSERNAENLSPGIVAEWRHDLRGSRLEEQELDGKILAKVEGALWSLQLLDDHRVATVPRLIRILVAVDPTRANAPRDEAGIMVGGLGEDGHGYVWDDLSLRGTPLRWAQTAVGGLYTWSAEAIVYEQNRLEEKTKEIVRTVDRKVKWLPVTATDNKLTRAEPVSALYEQGLVHHVWDRRRHPDNPLAQLEDEMISWDPRARMASPNRMDALVWLITALMLGEQKPKLFFT